MNKPQPPSTEKRDTESAYPTAFAAAVSRVLADEGGLVDDPADTGKVTKYGISQRQYPELDIARLSRDQAVEISNISRAAYNEGGLDLLRLLDAERVRIEAEVSWVQALESYHQSVVSLDYAEGVQP